MATNTQNILVLGDTHGEWGYLASILYYYRPDMCFILGDFGWWPGWGELPHYALPRDILEQIEIHFLDGNHENHMSLLGAAPRGHFQAEEIVHNIFYHPRGSTMTLPDGRTIFFAGGAKSLDWRDRKEGKSWFREEVLQREHLPKKLPKVDIVMSHTIPFEFGIDVGAHKGAGWDYTPDPSQDVLDDVLYDCKPKLWLAGHLHKRIDGEYNGTEYHVLDMVGSGCCRPEGMPNMYWLSGGPCIARDTSGWAFSDDHILTFLTTGNGLYGCADMSTLPPDLYALFEDRRKMYRTRTVNGVKGVIPGEADSFLNTVCRFHWNAAAAMGDRQKDK